MRRFDFGGKVAIVTGGNGGRGLAEAGASVIVTRRSGTKNDAAVEELTRIGAVASGIVVDVTIETECQAMAVDTVGYGWKPDIKFNAHTMLATRNDEHLTRDR